MHNRKLLVASDEGGK